MIKQSLVIVASLAIFSSCSTSPVHPAMDANRVVASDGHGEGTYFSKDIRNDDGRIQVLREFDLMRNNSGHNLKGIVIEVIPFNSYAMRTRVDVSLNGRTIDTHDIQVRNGRDFLYTDIDLEVRDEIRELSLNYNPREVSVRSITVLVNEDRPWENNRPNGGAYSQLFDRVMRTRGGGDYNLYIPPNVEARFLTLEAVNAPVLIYNIFASNQQVQMPGGFGSRLLPGYPVQVALPTFGRIDNIKITAEGMQMDTVGLKVTVSTSPNIGGDDHHGDGHGDHHGDGPGNNGPGNGPWPGSGNNGPGNNGPGNGPWPGPGNGPGNNGPGNNGPERPLPPRIVSDQCTVTRFDPAGMLILSYTQTATGPFGTDLKGQACQTAMMNCRAEIRGRQSCR